MKEQITCTWHKCWQPSLFSRMASWWVRVNCIYGVQWQLTDEWMNGGGGVSNASQKIKRAYEHFLLQKPAVDSLSLVLPIHSQQPIHHGRDNCKKTTITPMHPCWRSRMTGTEERSNGNWHSCGGRCCKWKLTVVTYLTGFSCAAVRFNRALPWTPTAQQMTMYDRNDRADCMFSIRLNQLLSM